MKFIIENPITTILAILGIWNPYSLALAGWFFIARWINPIIEKSIGREVELLLAGLLVGLTYLASGVYLFIKSVNFWT